MIEFENNKEDSNRLSRENKSLILRIQQLNCTVDKKTKSKSTNTEKKPIILKKPIEKTAHQASNSDNSVFNHDCASSGHREHSKKHPNHKDKLLMKCIISKSEKDVTQTLTANSSVMITNKLNDSNNTKSGKKLDHPNIIP